MKVHVEKEGHVPTKVQITGEAVIAFVTELEM